MRPLFRPEAVAARQQAWLGRVQLMRPLSVTVLTAGVALVVLLLAVFLGLAQYTRKATASGVLVPDRGLSRLVPAAAGMVLERRVTEGQAVREGDVLFVLALERPMLGAQAQAEVLRSLDERRRSLNTAAVQQQALLGAQQATLERRLAALKRELAQVDAEAALQQQRVKLAQQALARLEALQAAQFISAAQLQSKGEELLGLQAATQALARQRAALEREQAELEGESRALPLRAGGLAGGLEREQAVLARETAEQETDRRLIVRAPYAGRVSAVLAEPGQSVSPLSALASLVPEGAALQAHLYAPSSAVGFVRPDQEVQLRFDAFPYQKFGHWPGRVLQVSRTPLAASELASLALPSATAGEPMFRITVALEAAPGAEAVALVAGMRLQADVLLERRRLVEWLFEPLLALRGRS